MVMAQWFPSHLTTIQSLVWIPS